MGIRWLVHAHCAERAALHYVLPTRCRLCLGEKDGRPTQFNAAIACSVKLTLFNEPFFQTLKFLNIPDTTICNLRMFKKIFLLF